jgi:hypothetical protein
MTHTFQVWLGDDEADTWTLVNDGLKGSLRQLTPEGARREMGAGVTEPTVSHVIRMGNEAQTDVLGGRRLRDIADGEEYLVQGSRWREKPRPGNLRVTVANVPGTVAE